MTQATVLHLTFTPAERATLATLAAERYTVETCADDGDEWAALTPTAEADPRLYEEDRPGMVSVQLTGEPSRRFVAVGRDGRAAGPAGDDLGAVLLAAMH